ncbi:MAG: DNA polymerase III subunit gamma/tau, partial [Candidatus Paceibacteria bacterium]
MSTLYRLYRPQTFSDFVGQETSRRILQNALVYNRTVHSYLFTGPRGTGKTSMARIFAKALNCDALQTETGEVCNACTSCVSITEGSFVDLIEIDAASNRGIDEIRNLREAVRFAPSKKNGAKVYIIDEAHMLTKDASNALLKTLEEPPKDVYFVLVTTDADKLLPTIHSRVQTLSFYPLTHSQLKDKLTRILSHEGIQADDEVLQQIIVQAEGGARNAESLLGQLLSATNTSHITSDVAEPILGQNTQHEAYSLISLIADQNLAEAITFVNDLYSKGVAFGPFVDTLILTMRRILLARVSPDLILTSDLLDTDYQWIATLKDRLSPSQSEQIIRELRDAKSHINTALTPQLPLEVSLTKLIAESDTPASEQQTSQSDTSASQTPSSAAQHSSSVQSASSAESHSPSSQSQTQNSEPATPT